MRVQRIAAYGLGILALGCVAAEMYANPVLFGAGNKVTSKAVDTKPAPVKTDNLNAPAIDQTSDADTDDSDTSADSDLKADDLSLDLAQPAVSSNKPATDAANIRFVATQDPALSTTPALSLTPSAAEADLLAGLMDLASSGFFYSNFNSLGSGAGSGSTGTPQGNASNLSFAANDLSSSFASDGILHGDGGLGGGSGGSSGGSGGLAAADLPSDSIGSAVPLPSAALAAILPLALAGLVVARRSNAKVA